MKRCLVGTRSRNPGDCARGVTLIAWACGAAFVLALASTMAYAQMTTGTILGGVTDPSGAAIPGAKVTVTNLDTKIFKTFETDPSGNYIVSYLIPGTYEVTAEKQGFQKLTQTGITLQVDQKARVDLTLQLGAVTQVVTVTSEAPLLKTTSSEQSQVIASRQIVDLPLNVRNFAQLVSLSTGAVPSPGSLGGNINPDNPQGISDTNVNGLQADANNWQIDGVTDNEAFFSILSVNPSIDAIQEFKVSSNNYSAEFGRAGGANVQIAIKSGANSFHGVGFEFLRNSSLDANDFFSNRSGKRRLPFRQNQFGGNLGGPIKKDRTFFFGDYEGFRSRLGETALLTIPTGLQRQGDFSEPGNPVIFNPFDLDPTTGRPRPFKNNRIPQNAINSTAAKVMALLPPPNLNRPIGQANFIGTHSIAHDVDNFDIRLDHRIGDKDQFFTRYSYLSTLLNTPPFLGTVVGGDPFLAARAETRNQNGVISEIHSFTPRTINEFRFGINRVRTDWFPLDQNLKTSDQVGISGINSFCGFCGGLARINIAGFNSLGHTPFAPTFRHDTIFQWVDNMTFVRGKHTIKTGADLRRVRAELFQTANPIGQFDFDQRFTSNLGAAGTGSGLASLLLGFYEFAGRAAMPGFPSNRGNQLFFFGQDDFRVSDKLTLSLGLRYEYYSPITDAHGRLSQFDLATGDILVACIATTCSGLNPDRKDWAPRIGFAYTPDRGKTAIRSGFGISYFSPGFGGQMGTLNDNYPWVQGQGITPSNPLRISQGDPTISQGLPPLAPVEQRPGAPPGHLIPKGGASGGGFSSVFWMDPHLKMTRVYQWNFDIQRSITPNLLVDVAYVGNTVTGRFLNVPANFPQPGDDPSGKLSLQQRRPYFKVDPDLAQFTKRFNAGRTHYDSMQLKVEKRVSHGLSFLASYTVSKGFQVGSAFINPDLFMVKSRLGFDAPQRFVLSYIYELPFGRSKTYGDRWTGWMNAVLGGWQVNGITTYMTGFPFTPSISSNLDNGLGNRPNRVGSGAISNRTIDHWFDFNAFTVPAKNVYGNTGINILRGPGFRDWDLSIFKNFVFTESRHLQFRTEFFNLPNNVNFGLPNAFLCGGKCGEGTITTFARGSIPRQIQFALKLYF